MSKKKFEEKIGKTISDSEYDIIKIVGEYYPFISVSSPEEDLAKLYKQFGIIIFYDMINRAEKIRLLEGKLKATQAKEKDLKFEIKQAQIEKKINFYN